MTLILLAAVGAIVVGFVLSPVFSRAVSHPTRLTKAASELKSLAEEKTRILEAIKDLDFEYRAGKLSEGDYQRVRGEDMAQVAQIIARMEELSPDGKRPEETSPSSEQRGAPPEATAPASEIPCPDCQRANPANARFCLHCGARIQGSVECPACGTELPSKARFCSACGAATGT